MLCPQPYLCVFCKARSTSAVVQYLARCGLTERVYLHHLHFDPSGETTRIVADHYGHLLPSELGRLHRSTNGPRSRLFENVHSFCIHLRRQCAMLRGRIR